MGVRCGARVPLWRLLCAAGPTSANPFGRGPARCAPTRRPHAGCAHLCRGVRPHEQRRRGPGRSPARGQRRSGEVLGGAAPAKDLPPYERGPTLSVRGALLTFVWERAPAWRQGGGPVRYCTVPHPVCGAMAGMKHARRDRCWGAGPPPGPSLRACRVAAVALLRAVGAGGGDRLARRALPLCRYCTEDFCRTKI